MRILHVSDHLEIRGGAEVIPYLLTEGLRRQGHESWVHRMHSCEAHMVQERAQADLWHLHNMQSHCGLGLIRYLQEMGIPHLLSLHDWWHTGCPIRTLTWDEDEQELVCKCDPKRLDWIAWARDAVTVAHTQEQVRLTKLHAGFAPTYTIPHGIDTCLFSPGGPWPESPVILCGTARKAEFWKGGQLFREAIEILKQRLKGSPLGLITVRHLEGGLSQTQLRELYRRCSLAVFPSMCAESFGLMAVEAMACGRPVVTTDLGGYRETVLNGETGLRVPPRADLLADAIEGLLTGSDLRAMGRAAAVHVRRHYYSSRMVSDYVPVYQSLIERWPQEMRARSWRAW